MIIIIKVPRLIIYRVIKLSGNRPRTVLVARASASCHQMPKGQPTPPPLVTGGGAINKYQIRKA